VHARLSFKPQLRSENCLLLKRSNKDIRWPLLDDLIGALLKLRGHTEPKCLGGFQVDHQMVFRGQLHREISRLCPTQNPVDVNCGVPPKIPSVDAVRHQPATGDKEAVRVDGRQMKPRGQCDNQFAVVKCGRSRRYNEATIRFLRKSCDGFLNVCRIAARQPL